jgi:pimeloyl-ACP methyl ester carboxylesterase
MPTAGDLFYFASKQGVATKPAVVLIHGAGGDHLHWPHNIRRMGDYRVFAPDLPGHGKSGGIGEQTIGGYAKIVADWLIEIGVSRAVFVGHSMGGAIAQTLALDYADLVRGIVLVGTGSTLAVNPDLLEKLSVPSAFPNAVELIVKWSFSKDADEKLLRQVSQTMQKTRSTVVYGDFVACSAFNAGERVKGIQTPTLVICGGEDKMTPIALSEELTANIPDAALVTVEGAGHMVMIEKPEEAAAAIRGFLAAQIK